MASPQTGLMRSSAVHIAFALVAMGGWALFANRDHGLAAALPPALAQGAMSGAITAVLKTALERMSGRLGGWLAFAVPPAITASAILIVLILTHRLIGTPEVLRTIAVPWSVSTLYAILYSADLERRRA